MQQLYSVIYSALGLLLISEHTTAVFSSLIFSSNLLPLHFPSTSLLASLAPTLALLSCVSCSWTGFPPLMCQCTITVPWHSSAELSS